MHFYAFSVQFLGKRGLFQTILLCHCQVLINNQFHVKYQKYLMNQFWENYISMENRAISGIFGPIFGQTRVFPNKTIVSVWSTYHPATWCKIWKKSNEADLRKLHKYGKRGNFVYFQSNFRANKNFPKLACYVSLNYLSTINFMQNIKKI